MSNNWLTLNPVSGTGNGKIDVTATAHTGRVARTATITVSAPSLSQTKQVSVTQSEASPTHIVRLSPYMPDSPTKGDWDDTVEGSGTQQDPYSPEPNRPIDMYMVDSKSNYKYEKLNIDNTKSGSSSKNYVPWSVCVGGLTEAEKKSLLQQFPYGIIYSKKTRTDLPGHDTGWNEELDKILGWGDFYPFSGDESIVKVDYEQGQYVSMADAVGCDISSSAFSNITPVDLFIFDEMEFKSAAAAEGLWGQTTSSGIHNKLAEYFNRTYIDQREEEFTNLDLGKDNEWEIMPENFNTFRDYIFMKCGPTDETQKYQLIFTSYLDGTTDNVKTIYFTIPAISQLTVSPDSLSYTAEGGTDNINITTGQSTGWTASSN